MATEHAAGSQAAVIDTEHVLNTTSPETTDGAFQFLIDLSVLAAGDIVEIRIKEKVQSTSTQRLVWMGTYAHAQSEPIAASPPIILLHGWDITLTQTDGTARTFEWSIRKA